MTRPQAASRSQFGGLEARIRLLHNRYTLTDTVYCAA
jgi:hypothetical protein